MFKFMTLTLVVGLTTLVNGELFMQEEEGVQSSMFKQCDPKWADEHYGMDDGSTSVETIC